MGREGVIAYKFGWKKDCTTLGITWFILNLEEKKGPVAGAESATSWPDRGFVTKAASVQFRPLFAVKYVTRFVVSSHSISAKIVKAKALEWFQWKVSSYSVSGHKKCRFRKCSFQTLKEI